jgi:hypothetical protein
MRWPLACSLVWICFTGWLTGAHRVQGLECFTTVAPARAQIGQRIVLTVACRAAGTAAQGVSLDDKSLTIEFARRGDTGEPRYSFPNRKTMETDGMLIREGESSPVLKLKAGEKCERTFELNSMFPQELLRQGDFQIGFTLWDGQRQIRSKQAVLRLR